MNSNSTSSDAKLEERLRRAAIVSSEQLMLVRELQKDSPISLAEALVELEMLSTTEVARMIESLNEVKTVRLEDVQIDPDAVKHVPRRVAMDCQCIPVRKSGSALVVAASMTDGRRVLQQLRAVTDFDIVLLYAEPDAIEHALYIFYGDAHSTRSSAIGQASSSHLRTGLWSIRGPWKLTFETFLEHAGVARARELAKMIASGSGDALNSPLKLIGAAGSGKSHLLTAIKNYCLSKNPTYKGYFCEGASLRSLISDYSVARLIDAFRFEIRDCSLLLIDQFAEAWGNEFVEKEIADAILNLKSNGAAIVVSMSHEQFLAGPATCELQNVLQQGTEAEMHQPADDDLLRILSSRCNPDNTYDWQQVVAANGKSLTWSTLQEYALSTSSTICR